MQHLRSSSPVMQRQMTIGVLIEALQDWPAWHSLCRSCICFMSQMYSVLAIVWDGGGCQGYSCEMIRLVRARANPRLSPIKPCPSDDMLAEVPCQIRHHPCPHGEQWCQMADHLEEYTDSHLGHWRKSRQVPLVTCWLSCLAKLVITPACNLVSSGVKWLTIWRRSRQA